MKATVCRLRQWIFVVTICQALVATAQEDTVAVRYDFGPSHVPPQLGCTRVSIDQVYQDGGKYGLIHSSGNRERGWRKRGMHADTEMDSFVFDSGGLAFVQNLPPGDCFVSLASGDPQYNGSAPVAMNGTTISGIRETDPGGFLFLDRHRVSVVHGQLRIEIGGHGRLNWLAIVPASVEAASRSPGAMESKATVRVSREKAIAPVPEGEFAISSDEHGEIVRVNRSLIRDWQKVPGVKAHWNVLGPQNEDEAWIAVTCNFKDVDRDGRRDIFRMLIYQPFGQLARFDFDGNLVWKSEKLPPCSGDESGVPIVDMDGDGKYECLLSQWACLVCIDADSGHTKWRIPLDKGGKPGPGSWDYPMVVGHFDSPDRYAVVTRAGLQILCFDANGKQRWTHDLTGDTYGHELDRYDVDGDGLDELFIGRNRCTTALNHNGALLWEDGTQRNHTDFFAFGDLLVAGPHTEPRNYVRANPRIRRV